MTFNDVWYEAHYRILKAALIALHSLRTEGGRNIPRTGPALLIANHESFFDPVLVGVAAPRHLCHLARKTLYRHPILGPYLASLKSFPIDQDGIGIEGLRVVLQRLKAGHAVVVYPEGERTPTGQMLPLKPGIHLLIKRALVPVVPVGIAGAYAAWPRWRLAPIPAPLFLPAGEGTIAVSVGRPLDPHRLAALPREEALGELFEAIARTRARAERLRRKAEKA